MVDPRKRWKRPVVGSTWTDVEGRTLLVKVVNPLDRLGRHVVGIMHSDYCRGRTYSCDLLIWADVWRDQAPRLTPSMQQIG